MVQGKFMCSCYDPMFREEISVKGKDFDDIWDKAKKKAARKYGAKVKDVDITSSYWEEIK